MSVLDQAIAGMNPDKPFSDVSNSQFQDLVGQSLMGEDVQPEVEFDNREGQFHGLTENEAEVADTLTDSPDEGQPEEYAEHEQQPEFADEPQQFAAQPAEQEAQQPEAPIEVTPQAIQQSIEQIDAWIAERQLINSDESAQFASELGLDAAQAGPASQGMARIAVSAINTMENAGWNPVNVQELQPAQYSAIHDEISRSLLNTDPRLSGVSDPVAFGRYVWGGVLNFAHTVSTLGINASIDQYNNANFAQEWLGGLRQFFGINEQLPLRESVEYIDALTRPVLGMIQRLAAQRAEQPTRQSRRTSGKSKSNTKVPWSSNQDLFDGETVDLYRSQHGRL